MKGALVYMGLMWIITAAAAWGYLYHPLATAIVIIVSLGLLGLVLISELIYTLFTGRPP